MKMHVTTFLLALVTASVSFASDVWVDPVGGDDANPGTAALPFRTISHAVLQPAVTAHLAPGDYTVASGELFPIQLEDGDALVATAGRDQTRIRMPGVVAGMSVGIEIVGDVSISGLTLEQRGTEATAVQIGTFSLWPAPVVEFRGSRFVGGAAGIKSFAIGLSIEQCEFTDQAREALLIHGGLNVLVDVVIREVNRGVNVRTFNGFSGRLNVDRTSILDVTQEAILLSNGDTHGNQLNARLRDSLIAGHGIGVSGASGPFGSNVILRGCTIVSDRGVGVAVGADLTGCIVAGHPGGDLTASVDLSHCLIEDGLPPFSNSTNQMGDPQFVDRVGGDFRLGWGSPCIDSGFSYTGRDLLDRPRAVDGDLQLVPAPDMGAQEHQTLVGPASVNLGSPVPLQVTGPAGGFSTIAISPSGYAPAGAGTPYGRFFLDPSTVYRLTPVATFGMAPTLFNAPAFTDPALVGMQVGLQALTRSLDAPAAAAFSQPILVRIDA